MITIKKATQRFIGRCECGQAIGNGSRYRYDGKRRAICGCATCDPEIAGKFSTVSDGVRQSYKILYRADLLPYQEDKGFTHHEAKRGEVFVLASIPYDRALPLRREAFQGIGLHGSTCYISAKHIVG